MIVLFDLDDTLLDHSGADLDAALALRAAFAPERSPERFLLDWRRAQNRHYARYLAGEISFAEQRRERVRDATGAMWRDAEADMAFNFYFAAYRNAWRLFDDAHPCLAALSALPGLKLGLVTNGDGAVQRRKIGAMGLAALFQTIIISGECGLAKPDAQIFALACKRLGGAPADAFFIGDDQRVDAEAARAAGLRGFWLDRSDFGRADPERLTTLADVPALLARAGDRSPPPVPPQALDALAQD